MEFDIKRAEDKKKEIVNTLSSLLQTLGFEVDESHEMAEKITDVSIRVDPPEAEEIQLSYKLIVLSTPSGRGGGKSTKPGNMTINVSALIEAVANGSLAGATVAQIPWMAPFALLLLWNSLWRAAQVDLSEYEAATIYAMWVHRDRMANEIPSEGLLDKVNSHLIKYGRKSMTQQDLNFAVEKLLNIESIKRSKKNPANWWLCEWIQPTYR